MVTVTTESSRTWEWYVENADAVRLVYGDGGVYLHELSTEPFDAALYPWHLPIEEIRAGSSFYGKIPSGLCFRAKHPCGLVFNWTVEVYGSRNDFALDPDVFTRLFAALPDDAARAKVREALKPMAAGFHEYLASANAEAARRAAALRTLADFGVSR